LRYSVIIYTKVKLSLGHKQYKINLGILAMEKIETIDILRTALKALGYTIDTFELGRFKKNFTWIHHPEHSGMMTMSSDSPHYPFVTTSSHLICKDKSQAYDLASLKGITIPATVYVEKKDSNYTDAQTLLDTYKRLIVKPLDTSASKGLTLDITTQDQLVSAIAYAVEFSDSAIVQQQVFGEEIRFVVVDGKVEAGILRQTPSVNGDGISTLGELIKKENEVRKKMTNSLSAYLQLDKNAIDFTKFDMNKVYPKYERIELSKNLMLRHGGSVFNVSDKIDTSYISLVEKLVQPLGDGFLAVDIIIENYKAPATDTNYAFLEFNLTPSLTPFYSCRDGNHFKVAEEFLAPMIDTILRRGAS
jgi:D-alanine-D-alanine ligase-like ATP-grasp enzyme